MSSVHALSHMQYRAHCVGYFPLLPSFVKQAIAWGKGMPNMSSRVGLGRENADFATKDFLKRAGLRTDYVIKIDPSGVPESELLHVLSDLFKKTMLQETFSNFLYTTDPDVTLIAKPGDCPVAIVAATLPDGLPLLGLLHAGRTQLDTYVPSQAMALLQTLGCDMKSTFVGIAPSIAYDNYYVRSEDVEKLIKRNNWEMRKRAKEKDGKLFLDLLGYFFDQLIDAGIPEENIQAYQLDTLTAAQHRETFSQRYASYSGGDEQNGRFLVAAELAE